MKVSIQCPTRSCANVSIIPESLVGRMVRCKKCEGAFKAIPTQDGKPREAGSGGMPSAVQIFPNLPADFGRYRVMKKIGQGGMAAVFLAEDTQLGRQVALKLPSFGPQANQERIKRFVREARSSANLQHPNICTIFDADTINDQPFISMAYIEGQSLEELIDPEKPLNQLEAVSRARKVALALAYAHRMGIVHRDLKPANIMLTEDGEPIVMDFGLAKRYSDGDRMEAKLTQDGAFLGTPSYMSPEQVRGETDQIGPATDIYALGVILFELLTGHTPFSGTLAVIIGKILSAPVPPVEEYRKDVDPRLTVICMQAMAKNPKDRFATMADFASTLQRFLQAVALSNLKLDSAPVAAAKSSSKIALPPPPSKMSVIKAPAQKRVFAPFWIGGGALLILVALSFVVLRQIENSRLREEIANREAERLLARNVFPRSAATEKNRELPQEITLMLGKELKLSMVRIPQGKFMMGSPDSEEGRDTDEGPIHGVTLTKDFYLGKYEVTQQQWERVMGENPSLEKGIHLPVTNLSWKQCMEFIRAVNYRYQSEGNAGRIGLPTEAQWEYACRAGSNTKYSFGNANADLDQYSWYESNSDQKLHPVGLKKPNAFGLYDMHGNVWERCSNLGKPEYSNEPQSDPTGPSSGTTRVSRGGCFKNPPKNLRSAYRHASAMDEVERATGFRLALFPTE
jgi:serine/threonine protein kinase